MIFQGEVLLQKIQNRKNRREFWKSPKGTISKMLISAAGIALVTITPIGDFIKDKLNIGSTEDNDPQSTLTIDGSPTPAGTATATFLPTITNTPTPSNTPLPPTSTPTASSTPTETATPTATYTTTPEGSVGQPKHDTVAGIDNLIIAIKADDEATYTVKEQLNRAVEDEDTVNNQAFPTFMAILENTRAQLNNQPIPYTGISGLSSATVIRMPASLQAEQEPGSAYTDQREATLLWSTDRPASESYFADGLDDEVTLCLAELDNDIDPPNDIAIDPLKVNGQEDVVQVKFTLNGVKYTVPVHLESQRGVMMCNYDAPPASARNNNSSGSGKATATAPVPNTTATIPVPVATATQPAGPLGSLDQSSVKSAKVAFFSTEATNLNINDKIALLEDTIQRLKRELADGVSSIIFDEKAKAIEEQERKLFELKASTKTTENRPMRPTNKVIFDGHKVIDTPQKRRKQGFARKI